MNRMVSTFLGAALAVGFGGAGSAENEPGLPANPIPPEGGAIVLEEGPQTMTVVRIDEDANQLVARPVGGRDRTVVVDRATLMKHHGRGDAAGALELGDLDAGDTIVVVGSEQDGRTRALSIELVERGAGREPGGLPRPPKPPGGP